MPVESTTENTVETQVEADPVRDDVETDEQSNTEDAAKTQVEADPVREDTVETDEQSNAEEEPTVEVTADSPVSTLVDLGVPQRVVDVFDALPEGQRPTRLGQLWSFPDLTKVPGIGKASAAQIKAALAPHFEA